MCVSYLTRPTLHFLADLLRLIYCATQSFVIGDHIEEKVNRTTLREVIFIAKLNVFLLRIILLRVYENNDVNQTTLR